MHAVAAFFASIITFVSGFFAPAVASNSPVDVRMTQPAAAAVAHTEFAGDPFTDPTAASVAAAANPAAPAPVVSPPPTQTVINQPVIERIIERIVPQGGMISTETLAAILADFEQSIGNRIAALNPAPAAIPAQVAASGNAGSSGFFPASQRIDQLTNTAINTPTITGGAISGASSVGASSGSFDALSAGTLALSGTLTGTDASFSGTLTAGTLNVAGLSSQGALVGPYFTATSTTATSTFAGPFNLATGALHYDPTGYYGTPKITFGETTPVTIKINATDTGSFQLRRVGAWWGPQIRMGSGWGTVTAPATTTASQFLGTISFDAYNGGGFEAFSTGAQVHALAADDASSTNSSAHLAFSTTPTGATSVAERMRITSAGNVGIGTTTPGALLSANGNILGAGTLALTGTTGTTTIASGQGFTIGGSQFVVQQGSGNVGIGTNAPTSPLSIQLLNNNRVGITQTSLSTGYNRIDLNNTGGASTLGVADVGGVDSFLNAIPFAAFVGSNNATPLQLITNQTARVTVGASGNVGIGTTTPEHTLDVNGYTSFRQDALLRGGSKLTMYRSNTDSYAWSMYSDAGNTLTLTTGIGGSGTTRLSFTDSGLLSLNGNLAVTGTTGTTTLATGQGFTIGGSQFVVQQGSGNVGIGTTNPESRLSVTQAANATAATPSTYGLLISGPSNGYDDRYMNLGGDATYAYIQTWGTRPLYFNSQGGNALFGGSIGIGTTTPWGKLSVKGTGTGSGLAFAVADSANTPRFVIQDNGNVGIGTTNPGTKLDVEGASIPATIGSSNNTFVLNLKGNGDSTGAYLGSNAGALLFANSGGAENMRISSTGDVGIGTANPTTIGSAVTTLHIAGSSSNNNYGGGLALTSNDGSSVTSYIYPTNSGLFIQNAKAAPIVLQTNAAERMRIDALGNVGIGTAAPQDFGGNYRTLDVRGGDTSSGGFIFAGNSDASIVGQLAMSGAGPSIKVGSYTNHPLVFTVNNSERARIDTAGNVGIGTTTPWGRLSAQASDNSNTPQLVVGSSTATSLFVGANGRVGIGTNAPRAPLEVYDGLRLTYSGSGNPAGHTVLIGTDAGLNFSTPSIKFTSGNRLTASISDADYFELGSTGHTISTMDWGLNANTSGFSYNQAGSWANIPGYVRQLLNFTGTVNSEATLTQRGLHTAISDNSSSIANTIIGISADVSGGTNASANRYAAILMGGNVGIGTTTPWGKLSVQAADNSSAPQLVVASSTATSLIVDKRGNVGIGTNAPTANLDIDGFSGSIDGLRINGTGTGPRLRINDATGALATIIDSSGNLGVGGVTPLSRLHVSHSDTGVLVDFTNTNASGYGLRVQTADTSNSRYALNVLANGGSTNALYVSNAGLVGIGTTSPSSLLHLGSTGNTVLTIDAGWPVGAARIDFKQNGTSYGIVDFDGNNFNVGNLYVNGATILKAGNSERMRITSAGNVGIGTTTPGAKLDVLGDQWLSLTANQTRSLNFHNLTNSVTYGRLQYTDTTGVLDLANLNAYPVTISTNGSERLRVDSSGFVGIGTTSPTAQLHTTGTVRFSNFGAGTLTTDASGNVSVSSDEHLKTVDAPFTRGLADIAKLSPISYHWNATSGLDTTTQYAGFSAQNVQAAIPEAVGSMAAPCHTSSSADEARDPGSDPSVVRPCDSAPRYLTLQDRPLIAAVVNATKEIGTIGGTFRTTLIAWLGNASNGIGDLFAKDIYASNGTFDTTTANTTNTRELCITDGANDNTPLCLTKSQLAAVLAATGQTAGSPSASALAGASQPPLIELNGNASSTIEVGNTYNDLGARIVAPTSDLNLGLTIILDGATTTQVSIDTTSPGVHTILYTATSPTTGLTGSVMRTVIISPADETPEPPANDNPFNLAPANDNASSTSLLIVEPTASI